MNHSMITSRVSLNALQQKLDVLANNIANVNTVGYKRKDATFEDILTNIKDQPKSFEQEGRLSPLGFNQTWGTKLSMVQTNFTQGTMQNTGVETDLALEGDGLFQVSAATKDAQGKPIPNPNPVYTRDGSFQLTFLENDPDNAYLAAKEGQMVLGTDRNFIKIPKNLKFSVDSDGTVRTYNPNVPEQPAQAIGKLMVVRALKPQFLQPIGDNLYQVPAGLATGGQVVEPAGQSTVGPSIAVRQGFLEQSNVNLTDEMAELMEVQRAFQLSSRALTSSDTMAGLANNLRG